MISWVQAALLGLMSCCAASTIACLGTTVGNYTLNRPLIASVFVGLILGDVKGCIQIAIPMPVSYTHLDVYKRQGSSGLCERAVQQKRNCTGTFTLWID